MANKDCEEIICDDYDNLSISSTPSRSNNDHDSSSIISMNTPNRNQIAEDFFSVDEQSSNKNLFQNSNSMTNNPTTDKNIGKSCEKYLDDINYKSLITPTSSKVINDRSDNKKKTILTLSSCRKQKPEFFSAFDDESSSIDYKFQSSSKIIQNDTSKQSIEKITGNNIFHTQTLQEKNLNQQVNVNHTFMSLEGQEKIDFLNQFTKNKNLNHILKKIFLHLSYKDITTMISVSKIWQNAIINSTEAQKKMESIFIQAILYYCHANVDISDDYKCLIENILFDLKKHLQYN